MTEAEWLATTELGPSSLGLLPTRPRDRKLRPFAVACCQRTERFLGKDERLRQGLEVATRFAEGNATSAERRSARRAAQAFIETLRYRQAGSAVYNSLCKSSFLCAIYSKDDALRAIERKLSRTRHLMEWIIGLQPSLLA